MMMKSGCALILEMLDRVTNEIVSENACNSGRVPRRPKCIDAFIVRGVSLALWGHPEKVAH
jgi:hypothetical protein